MKKFNITVKREPVSSTREKYNNAFYEAFDLDKETDLLHLNQSIDEWDSIGHMI